ncbi:MAG: purine-nucleoside phosphorylase [Bacteroidota bacterium]
MLEKTISIVEHLRRTTAGFTPEYGIILGSGLGGLVNEITIEHALDYASIPGFPVSTVKGHSGRLIFGTLSGKKVVALQGRFHFYEGYSMQELTLPVRVFKELGIQRLIVSNAAGGMNPDFKIGDLVILRDHINLMPDNPLIGKNIDHWGPRFPDMSEPYDSQIAELAGTIAAAAGVRFHFGVYAALTGPCFETPAEYRWLRTIGADVVGMSTVPEVIVARHMNIPCFAVSVVTDLGGFEPIQKVSHEEVLEVATASEKKLTALVKELLNKLD